MSGFSNSSNRKVEIAAMILFIILPFLGFYLGVKYGRILSQAERNCLEIINTTLLDR